MNKWPEQRNRAFGANHVDLWRRQLEIRFLFRILTDVDRMAQRARMSAVERLRNCLAQRRVLRVIDHHGRPCERLQSDPMQTNRQTKCADRGDPTNAPKHDCEANHRMVLCQSRLDDGWSVRN